MEEREYLLEQMNLYGRTVLASPQFRRTFTQTHHFRTTVGDHSVNVTLASLWLCRFLSRFGIHTDPKRMITAALCHDLGIIGRYDKFNSNRECCRQHPIDSAAIAKEFLPNVDQETLEIIKDHMWPVTGSMPRTWEGFIITIADKYCAVRELTGREYHTQKISLRPAAVRR